MNTSKEGECEICEIPYPYLQRDHIVARWLGGSDEEENLQWICPNCHVIKTREEQRLPEYGQYCFDKSRKNKGKPRRFIRPEGYEFPEEGRKRMREAQLKYLASLTPEQREQRVKNSVQKAGNRGKQQSYWDSLSPKQRKERGGLPSPKIRSYWDSRTLEQREEHGRLISLGLEKKKNRDRFYDDMGDKRSTR